VPVAHACHPSYLGGRDQDDHGSNPTQANSLGPYLEEKKKKNQKKNPFTKNRAGVVAQGCRP
jgi:hypothetical protein